MFGRLKVGIMGTGRIADHMANTLKEMRSATLYAVGSRTKEKAEKFAHSYGAKKAYGSYEDLVLDPKVDLIYIATPHSEHFNNVKLALNAGKHVLCEKAFMLNEAQAKEVFDLAEEKKLLLTEAMWIRYMPIMVKLKEVLASNVIGAPSLLTASLGYNIVYKDRINQPALGGGALLDLGVYPLNFASIVFGNDVADIVSICTFNNLGMDMQDSITLRYRDGKMAVINATVLSKSDSSGVIYGSKGYIVVDNINNPGGITVYDDSNNKIAYYKRPKQKTGYEYEVEACIKAINEKWLECPEMPHAETLKMMNMMDFIRKSNNIVFPGEETEEGAADNAAEPLMIETSKEENASAATAPEAEAVKAPATEAETAEAAETASEATTLDTAPEADTQ